MSSSKPSGLPQEPSQEELRERDERKRAQARERMARRRATIKTFPPNVQEEFARRAREARAKYRKQNRYLLMYKAECRRRKAKKGLSEDAEAHDSSSEASASPFTPLPTPLPNNIVQLSPSHLPGLPNLHYRFDGISFSIDHSHTHSTYDINPRCRARHSYSLQKQRLSLNHLCGDDDSIQAPVPMVCPDMRKSYLLDRNRDSHTVKFGRDASVGCRAGGDLSRH
ncbi:hypothetical protein C8R45DRAFT_1080265 [Mycena sanguinolenta]|nr:hypothetical protein C8R45DRAFT_1080265 [Mycena sanguinolenta]